MLDHASSPRRGRAAAAGWHLGSGAASAARRSAVRSCPELSELSDPAVRSESLFGEQEFTRYADYRSGDSFAREYLVIAGSSGAERGMRRCGRTGPEGQGGGFMGDPDWDDSEGGRDARVRQGIAQARV